MLHNFSTGPKFVARTMTKAHHEWAMKAVPTNAKAQMMPGTRREKKKRKLIQTLAMRSYDSLLGKRSAIKDGSSHLYLETDRHRPPTHVAPETTPLRFRS